MLLIRQRFFLTSEPIQQELFLSLWLLIGCSVKKNNCRGLVSVTKGQGKLVEPVQIEWYKTVLLRSDVMTKYNINVLLGLQQYYYIIYSSADHFFH